MPELRASGPHPAFLTNPAAEVPASGIDPHDGKSASMQVPQGSPRVRAVSRDGELVAIGEITLPNVYHPAVVL